MSPPRSTDEVRAAVAEALQAGARLTIAGGGSKQEIGAPERTGATLNLRGLSGIVAYDPADLVLTARAGTPLAEIEDVVAAKGQMLAFEPYDHGPIFGSTAGAATIGGVIAAGVAGPRRLSAGGARDHLLGFEAVSGRGERFVAGGKVVKNVTGYDLSKLMAGSWGRLAVLTEVTLKVLPLPRTAITLKVRGLGPGPALGLMARAMRTTLEVSAACHLPATLSDGGAETGFRLEGFGPSVEARARALAILLDGEGPVERLDAEASTAFWAGIAIAAPLGPSGILWRIIVPPSAAGRVIAALAPASRFLLDWAGGLIWLISDGDPAGLRRTVEAAGGHATLVRAPAALRASVPALHPEAESVAALSARVRRAFDPGGVFETGRFAEVPHAH